MSRFEQVWSRPGFGRFEGADQRGVYFTVANDGRALHALDATTGKSLWAAQLAQPVNDWVQVHVVSGGVVVEYSPAQPSQVANVLRFSADDGKPTWSVVVDCANANSTSAGGHLYLLCGGTVASQSAELRELDPMTGRELARVALAGPVEFASGGEVCRLAEGRVSCARLSPSGLTPLWSVATDESVDDVEIVGDLLLLAGDQECVARHATDGSVAWKHPGELLISGGDGSRLVTWRGEDIEVLRTSDGSVLAKVRNAGKGGADVLSDGRTMLIAPHGPGDGRVFLLTPGSQPRAIAGNVPFLDVIVGDVILSKNVGMSGINRDVAPLEAYSLSHFAPPLEQLGPYERLVATLELHTVDYGWSETLAELRKIPDWQASLEKVVATGPERVRSVAVSIAGLTGEPRYLAALRARLAAVAAPASAPEWPTVVDLSQALANLDTPDAAEALLAFWQRVGNKLEPWRRTVLKDIVSSAVWRYSARKDWVTCKDLQLPKADVAPDRAVLGTNSPGVEYRVDGQRRWAAICEARTDDDRNGRIEVTLGHHGDTYGDELRPYLVLGDGPGTEVDDVVSSDAGGRWIVVTRDMCVHLVESSTGKASVLKGADGRQANPASAEHRAASFSQDGKALLYLRSDGSNTTVVVRDLESGAEQRVQPGPGILTEAYFDASDRWVVMEFLERDTNGDGVLSMPMMASTLGARRCRAPVLSATFFGQIGDVPVQRVWPRSGGAVEEVPPGPRLQRAHEVAAAFQVAPAAKQPAPLPSRADGGLHRSLPLGPFHWQRRSH